MEKGLIVSDHARQRIKERCGISKKSADRVCALATRRGVVRENTKGALRKWLDNNVRDNRDLLVYGDKAFVISAENVVVTVLQIPQCLTRNMSNMLVSMA